MAREVIDGKNVHGTLVTKNPSGLKTYKEIDADGGSKRVYQERYKYFSLPPARSTTTGCVSTTPVGKHSQLTYFNH